MPKSKSKSKSKTSTKQSQKQKQQIVVNVNSNNKRKSTHYHHKNSNNTPSHIVVPSTNHHMMFMPQPQGLPPPNLLGDNAYGIGQARLLDPVIQRMHENIQQLQQNALNNSMQQDVLNDIQQQRRQDRRYEQEQQFYRRNDYKSPSARGVAGAGYAYSTNVSDQAARNRERTLSVHSEDEVRQFSQMHDLSETERSVATDFLQRTLAANTPKKKEEVHATVDTDGIIYHTEPASMADLASGAFDGSLVKTPALFTTPKSPYLLPFRTRWKEGNTHEHIDEHGNIVPQSVVDATIEKFYSSPSPHLLLENTPSKAVSKIEDIKYASDANATDPVLIKKIEQSKEKRESMQNEQRRKQREQAEQEKYIAEQQRLAKEADEAERARQTDAQIQQLRQEKHKQRQRAEEVASSTKFESTEELITAFEDVEQLLTKKSSSEITEEDKKKYNRLRQAFGLGHVSRIVKMEPITNFLNDKKNRALYNELKMQHRPPTSVVPTSRFGTGTLVRGAELLSNTSQPKKIIIEEQGGGGAKQSRERK